MHREEKTCSKEMGKNESNVGRKLSRRPQTQIGSHTNIVEDIEDAILHWNVFTFCSIVKNHHEQIKYC